MGHVVMEQRPGVPLLRSLADREVAGLGCGHALQRVPVRFGSILRGYHVRYVKPYLTFVQRCLAGFPALMAQGISTRGNYGRVHTNAESFA